MQDTIQIKHHYLLFAKEDQLQLSHFLLVPEHPQQCLGDRTIHLSSPTALVRKRAMGATRSDRGGVGTEQWEVQEYPGLRPHRWGV